MGYCCNRKIFADATIVQDDVLYLISDSTVDPQNGCEYQLVITTNIPASTTVMPAYVQFGGVNYPLLDWNGNTLYSDQLRFFVRTCRMNLFAPVVYGNNTQHFSICTRLPASIAAGIEVGR